MSTAISWTNETWNPVVGCTPVSAGCDHCYAKTLHDMRHKAFLAGKRVLPQYGWPFEKVQLKPERLEQPMHWKAPRRVFVNSVSDLFHKDVPESFLDRVFAIMAITPRHTYQILTKRPARMRKYITTPGRAGAISAVLYESGLPFISPDNMPWPLPNVQLGTSVEHQAAADTRVPELLATPAATIFLSCEPLLSDVFLGKVGRGPYFNAIDGWRLDDSGVAAASPARPLDWVIIGGESGPGHREMDLRWLRSLVDQCRSGGVPVFVKQDSASKSEQRGRIPDDLWIREYPRVAEVAV